MSIGGKNVYDRNFYFRFIVICFAGVAAFAVLIGWRAQLLFNTEYIDVPTAPHHKAKANTTSTKLNLLKTVNATNQIQN